MARLKPQSMKVAVKDLGLFNANAQEKRNKKSVDVRTDIAIQRNYVWDEDRKSLFVHSLLEGYPIPPIYALNDDGFVWLLDGKQRVTTAISFVNDEWALSENTPPVVDEDDEEIEIAGFFFNQLPQPLKDEIRLATFQFVTFRDLEDSDRDEIFLRLNNGAALKPIELTRVLGGSKLMDFIQGIANSKFFQESMKMTESAKLRFVDEELVLQIMALLNNKGEPIELSSKSLKYLASQLKNAFNEDLAIMTEEVVEYLGKAFPTQSHPYNDKRGYEKFMKKVNIPMLSVMAQRAIERDIDPEVFGGWAQDFFYERHNRTGGEYSKVAGQGSAKKENVGKRLAIMGADFDKYVNVGTSYKMPEPKLTRKEQREWEAILAEQNKGTDGANDEANNGANADADANVGDNPDANTGEDTGADTGTEKKEEAVVH